MKNRTNLSIKIVTLFALLLSTALFTKLEAQNTFHLNGRTLVQDAGKYFTINNNDTLFVDTKYITIKFKPQAEHAGQLKVTSNYDLQYIGNTANTYYVFKINGTQVYPQLIADLNLLDEVDQTILGYAGKYMDDNPFPNDPGNQYLSVNVDDAWWVGYTWDGSPEGEYLNLIGAWGEYTTGNPNLSVGIIDMGNDWSQTDMPSDNMLGWNFVTGTNNTYPDHSVVESTHGTKMTSIICSKTNNDSDIFGVAGGWQNDGNGVKPIMAVNGQVLVGSEYGPSPALVPLCIDYLVQQGVRVINMSFGWLGLTEQEQQAMKSAIDSAMYGTGHEPVICIASAGNYSTGGNSSIIFPASYEPVIAVGGVDKFHTRGNYNGFRSCYGPELDFVTSFESYYNQGNIPINSEIRRLGFDRGTSFSAAMLSGVVSLMLSVNPCLTPTQVIEALKASCYKTPQYGYTNGWNMNVGFGFPNAKKAIEAAMGEEGKELKADETWSIDRNFRSEISVPAGKTLTLQNMTLRMWEDAGITVKKGGKLIIINSTVTANCNGMWKGITVEGDNTLTQQYYSNQGYLSIQNSTIEHAKNGVTTTRGGGIIQAANSYFVNNTRSLNVDSYSLSNYRTSFSVCDFIVNNEHRDWSNFQSLVYINSNLGIKFYGCNFKNENTQNGNIGYGIYSYGSNYLVDGSCRNPLIMPCPESSVMRSVFSNLQYGIYSSYSTNGKIVVDHSDFQDNDRGIYFSNCNYADVLRCNFNIPDYYLPSGLTPYGVYFNYGTGYHIEADTFQCNTANTTGSVGLYILSSGGEQNYVYNNTFARLSRAAVADGENRIAGGATGLCYKCNDFTSNGTDIDIVRTPNTPLLSTHGISNYQGLPSAGSASTNKDTLAASNIFSSSQNVWNIRNENNTSNYYYQENYPYQSKIIPDPVLNINRYQNNGTTYNKSLVCKSRIYGGGMIGSELLASKNAAQVNAEVAGLVLQNTVDGGNTANLTFEVIGSSPSEALELRNQLIIESPYLSDTVLKTTIDRENVLPNAMLRDILVENPQAAKSDELVSMLDERWEPMPDYMKDEIASGKTVIGGREQLEAKHDGWLQQISYLNNQIIANYLGDTVNPNAINELKAYLQNENTKQSGFELAVICLQKGDYNGAAQAISSLQANFTLSESESQQATDYHALITIIAGLQADTMAFNEVDSLHAIPLFTLYNSSENNASVIARDILIASGNLNYQEPVNGEVNSKSAVVEIPANKPVNAAKRKMEQISVFPNPATTYTIVEYMLPAKAVNASLSICTLNGNILWQQDIKKAKDQLVVDLSGFASGNYTVSLLSGKQPIATKTITISK